MAVMEVVRVTERTKALICRSCGHVTFRADPRYCDECGEAVESIRDSENDVFDAASMYAHDVGFDEGYESAVQEFEGM